MLLHISYRGLVGCAFERTSPLFAYLRTIQARQNKGSPTFQTPSICRTKVRHGSASLLRRAFSFGGLDYGQARLHAGCNLDDPGCRLPLSPSNVKRHADASSIKINQTGSALLPLSRFTPHVFALQYIRLTISPARRSFGQSPTINLSCPLSCTLSTFQLSHGLFVHSVCDVLLPVCACYCEHCDSDCCAVLPASRFVRRQELLRWLRLLHCV